MASFRWIRAACTLHDIFFSSWRIAACAWCCSSFEWVMDWWDWIGRGWTLQRGCGCSLDGLKICYEENWFLFLLKLKRKSYSGLNWEKTSFKGSRSVRTTICFLGYLWQFYLANCIKDSSCSSGTEGDILFKEIWFLLIINTSSILTVSHCSDSI